MNSHQMGLSNDSPAEPSYGARQALALQENIDQHHGAQLGLISADSSLIQELLFLDNQIREKRAKDQTQQTSAIQRNLISTDYEELEDTNYFERLASMNDESGS